MVKYYFDQRLQRCWVSNCTCLHLYLLRKSLVLVSPKWSLSQKFLLIKKWLGVSASKSFTLSLFAVHGLLLIFSTSVNTVIIWKLGRNLSLIIWSSDNFTTRTSLSHAPPMCGELGGLNFHLIICWSVKFVILSRFNCGCPKFNSWVALWNWIHNLAPLYWVYLFFWWICRAFINESVKWFYQLQMNCSCYHTSKQTTPSL